MVLAYLFKEVGQPFALAHVNFQLRGEDSNSDEEQVCQWAEMNQVRVFVKHFDTKAIKEQEGGSTQMVARKLRYNWFSELVPEHGFSFVATAHHLDDSIETFLINLSRKTGISGLTGISANEKGVIRPLLPFTKAQLERYAWQKGISWREDVSNSGDHYLRNRIRHHIIPLFQQENSHWKESMQETLKYLDQANRSLGIYFSRLKAEVNYSSGKMQLTELLKIDPLAIFLHACFNGDQLAEVEKALKQPEEKSWYSGSHRLVLSQGSLLWDELGTKTVEEIINEFSDFEKKLNIRYQLIEQPDYQEMVKQAIETGNKTAFLDADLLDFPLCSSCARPGEGFYPIGKGGFKLISDYFNDQKMNKLERERQIILRSAKNDIIWVIGKRIDNRFKISPNTRRVLVLVVNN